MRLGNVKKELVLFPLRSAFTTFAQQNKGIITKDMEIKDFYQIRENFHRHPELSGKEKETARRVADLLKGMQPTHLYTGIGGHGVIAEYVFAEEGETLLFRADMDAVAIEEHGGTGHDSLNPGTAHKCGHDGHTTILLAFADLLHRYPLAKGKILLLFQPAEETGEGAMKMLEDPFFNGRHIDHVFALHNLPGYPTAAVVCRPGSFTCSVVSCSIEITGKTSHAAEPEKALSPTPLLLQLLRTAESWDCNTPGKETYFRSTLIELHIGEEAYGVAAGQGVIRFTFRAATEKNLQTRIREMEEMVAAIPKTNPEYNVRLQWLEPFQANENTMKEAGWIKQAAQAQGLPYIEAEVPFAWGEDFGAFTQRYPGALFGLGAGTKTPPLHSPKYDFPNELIEKGAHIFYEIAKIALESRGKQE